MENEKITIKYLNRFEKIYDYLHKKELKILNSNSFPIRNAESNRKNNALQCTLAHIKYHAIIEDYKRIILSTAEIVREIELSNNSISYSVIIARLIHDKYLSYNNNFQIITESFLLKDIGRYLGIDIINGFGCCKHMSGISEDTFSNIGLYNSFMPCFSTPDKTIPSKKIAKQSANHCVNIIEYKGVYYTYDTIHRILYKFKNGVVMTPYSKSFIVDANLYYKPLSDMLYNNISRDKVIEKIKILDEWSKKEPISYQEFQEILTDTNNRYDRNTNLLDEFNNDTKYYKKRIVSNL